MKKPGCNRCAWVTAAFEKTEALEAIVLANSMTRVATSADKIIIVPHDIQDSILDHLVRAFDVVLPLYHNGLPLKNLKVFQYALLYSWSLTMYDKCVFLHPNSLMLKFCDEIFLKEEITTTPLMTSGEVPSAIALKPCIKTYRKITKIAFSSSSNDLTELLILAFKNGIQLGKNTLPNDYNFSGASLPADDENYEKNLDTAKIAYFGACKPWRSLTESRRENHENMDGKNNTLQQSWMQIFENDVRRQLNAQTINAFGLKESLFCCDRMLNKNGDEKISEESEDTLDNKEYHILTLSAKSDNDLLELSNKYVSYLEKHPTVSIQDLAFTANTAQSHLEKRACVIGTSVEELKQQIQNKKVICKSLSSKPKIAFLYTGHGSSYVGMARDLYAVNRVFRNAFNECLEILDKKYEISLREVVWNENYHHYMDFICYSHTAIFSVAYGLTKMWKSFGVEPEFISGHSAGESAAATAAGIFSLEHGISLVMNLATFIHKHLPDGAMMALRATEGKVSKLIASFLEGKTESEEHWLDISLINSPQQVIVSGPRNTVKMFNAYCTESGVKSQLVPGKDAFHSRAMEVIRKEYREFSGTLTFNPPRCSFVSARTGKVVDGVDPDYLVENMLKSVNYPAAAKTMASNGCNVYIEIGATPILLTLCMASTNLTEDVLWLPSIRRNENNWKTVLEAVGNLHTQGYPINWSAVEDNQEPRNKIDLPTQGTKSKNCFYTKK